MIESFSMSNNKENMTASESQSPVQTLEEEYIYSLSPKELQAYEIAKHHLQSSFSLKKSNGFLVFCKAKSQTDATK